MIRVLSIPGRSHENRFFGLLAGALECQGMAVVEPTARNLAGFSFDVLHLNFPTHYITENRIARATMASLAFGGYLMLARLLGRKVIYTVHDVMPLRARHVFLTRQFLRLTHALTNGFVFLSQSSRDVFVSHYEADQDKPWILTPHGPYPAAQLSTSGRLKRRDTLMGRDHAFVIGFLGSIKPYKNIAALAGLPRRLADGRAVRVLVAGLVERGYQDAAQDALAALPPGMVVRIDKRLDDDELDRLIQVVDVVLLPYVKGSNSEVAMLVLSNRARLIGSDLPVFDELARTVGEPWVYSFSEGSSGRSLGEVVESVARREVTEADEAALSDYLRRVSYAETARAVEELCKRL